MKSDFLAAVSAAAAFSFPWMVSCTEAFGPTAFLLRGGSLSPTNNNGNKWHYQLAASATLAEVPTTPIPGMKPGTSGLRKKVEVWQGKDDTANKYYVENFIQSLLDTAQANNGGEMLQTIIVAGDGRYFNDQAIQIICRVLAANGVENIWVPQGGIMSTPAVSAAIRTRDGGAAQGGIILTASHNPGGPGEDFGIKYNEGYGQPAGEEFTDALYERSMKISSFKTMEGSPDIDLNAAPGTTFSLTPTSTVTIIDPFAEYLEVLKSCFDFDAMKDFAKRPDFSIVFDGMHGAGGPFARRILVEELGFPKESLMRCDPRPDFGKCHPDPNLTYAAELVKKMGLKPDGSADESAIVEDLPTLGAANDGDGDRNLIAGAGCFVTPSDSLAMICDNWKAIPHFARAGGPKGVARSMPSSAALDVVAEALNIPFFSTPTGWKFFGNLMGSKEQFGKRDYTPFLCGEESFGTGSDHIREKDGLWAMLAWISILMDVNKDTPPGQPLVSVRDVVEKHWEKYGRHFYCRYDYEAVESDAANKMMDLIRDQFVNGDLSTIPDDGSGIKLVGAEEFSYTDPVDGSTTSKQGLVLSFVDGNGEPARVVFRLSGTGSAGATIRMYLERYEQDTSKHGESAPVALKSLADRAIGLVQLVELTGRDSPSVIT
ncbi:phosphoglucomutase/phosphomannomutase domain containing protein [Nitzschia inconspicua]|uniref:Phosphoglucomutase/phosphomannomutase domain containing protein n=1 Tax=Nitzschia inconspicua TaxID=303405 RepID=A0A9K3LP05_9STRA|nr:phosphoglucomutase/phosphomannomutase domain containing protein [Nitzschia inconspicua]